MLFLIPAVYYGEDSGLAVCLAGLEENVTYDKLTLALDDGAEIEVERDMDTPFYSKEHSFGGLRRGQIYKVTGLAENGDNIIKSTVLLPAQQGKVKPTAKRIKAKTVTMEEEKGSGAIGGGMSPMKVTVD